MGASLPPVNTAALNDAVLRLAPPKAWPAQGAATSFAWGNYPVSTPVENIAGWTRYAGSAGQITTDSIGGLNFNGTTDCFYGYDTGSTSHYIEATISSPAGLNFPLCVRGTTDPVGATYVGFRANNSANTLEIFYRIVGASTSLLSVPATASFLSKTYRLEARADDTVALYCNGDLVGVTAALPATFANATLVGMGPHNSSQSHVFTNPMTIYSGPSLHGLATGGWCWFNGPLAVAAPTQNKTFFATELPMPPKGTSGNNFGYARANSLDHSTGVVASYNLIGADGWDDDHCVPGIMIRPDGRLIAFYSLHIDTVGLRYRISVNPYDVTAWGAETVFAVPTRGGVTYPKPYMLSAESNKVWVVYRDGPDICAISSADIATVAAPASDGAAQTAATWGTSATWIPAPFTAQKSIYAKCWSNNVDRIDLALTNAEAGAAGHKTDIRHAYYKGGSIYSSFGKPFAAPAVTTFTCTSGSTTITVASASGLAVGMTVDAPSYIQFGTTIVGISGTTITISVATLAAAASAAPVSFFSTGLFTDCTPVATSAAPDNMGDVWVWDIVRDTTTGVIQVVFAQFLTAGVGYPIVYWYARWDGLRWTKAQIPSTTTGAIVQTANSETYYAPGICLDSQIPGLIYACMGDAAATVSDIYRITTADGGLTFSAPRKVSATGISGALFGGKQCRPVVPVNRDPRAGVLWLRGWYNYYTYTTSSQAGVPNCSYATDIMSAPV